MNSPKTYMTVRYDTAIIMYAIIIRKITLIGINLALTTL